MSVTILPPLPLSRALAMFNYEEKQKRENQILADFRSLVQTKLGDYT